MRETAAEKNSRLLYILLAIGGGLFGAHNFYAGRRKWAVFQLLLTVLSFGLLGGITFLTVLTDIFCFFPETGEFRKRRLFPFTAVILLLFALPALGIYALYRHEQKEQCFFNIANIGFALKQYAAEHAGKLPRGDNDSGLLELYELNIPAESMICPVTEERKYVYLGGADSSMKRCPVFFELPTGHRSGETIVLYADGELETLSLPGCETAAEVLEYLEKNAADEKSKHFLRRKRILFEENSKR